MISLLPFLFSKWRPRNISQSKKQKNKTHLMMYESAAKLYLTQKMLPNMGVNCVGLLFRIPPLQGKKKNNKSGLRQDTIGGFCFMQEHIQMSLYPVLRPPPPKWRRACCCRGPIRFWNIGWSKVPERCTGSPQRQNRFSALGSVGNWTPRWHSCSLKRCCSSYCSSLGFTFCWVRICTSPLYQTPKHQLRREERLFWIWGRDLRCPLI